MKSITKMYLASIIYIVIHKTSEYDEGTGCFDNYYQAAADEKVLDFILSIPYFDNRLKDFIVGNLKEDSIIITTEWEDEFIDKCFLWAESKDWSAGIISFVSKIIESVEPANKLCLPY